MQKGLSTALKVTVVAVVILIVAVVVLSVFSGGMGNVGKTINQWFAWIEGKTPDDLDGDRGGQYQQPSTTGAPKWTNIVYRK